MNFIFQSYIEFSIFASIFLISKISFFVLKAPLQSILLCHIHEILQLYEDDSSLKISVSFHCFGFFQVPFSLDCSALYISWDKHFLNVQFKAFKNRLSTSGILGTAEVRVQSSLQGIWYKAKTPATLSPWLPTCTKM